MEYVQIESVEELESYFDKYQDGYLFRGQTNHYTDQDGLLNIPTSFSRHGCIPPLMFKWTHYSNSIIRALTELDYHDIDTELSQVILQHYGWRSFYVDLTKIQHIASWFALNKHEQTKVIHMCENFDEEPVNLIYNTAKYTNTINSGHIYVIDMLVLKKLGVKIHDLTEIADNEGVLRFSAQGACLVGNLQKRLPPQSVILHLEVNNNVLKEFCKKNAVTKITDVFPDRKKDYVLDLLLSLPWTKVPIKSPIPFYKRSLELPEYDTIYTKHLPPKITLFENFWISDTKDEFDSPFKETISYKLPEVSYYANTKETFDLGLVNNILSQYESFVIELDGLIKIVENQAKFEYEKGIYVKREKEGFISISGIVVEHPGHIVSKMIMSHGWFYKIDNGKWIRVEHNMQCPCNNDLRHELQFSLLRMLNESLKEKELIKENDLSYRHKEVIKDGSTLWRKGLHFTKGDEEKLKGSE